MLGLSQGFFSNLGQIDVYVQCLRPLRPHAIKNQFVSFFITTNVLLTNEEGVAKNKEDPRKPFS